MLFLLKYVKLESPISDGLAEIPTKYSQTLDKELWITFIIFCISLYLLFMGKFTKRLSLAIVISIAFVRYMEQFKSLELKNFEGIFKTIFIRTKNFIVYVTQDSMLGIIIVSLVIAVLFVYLLSIIRLVLGLFATYVFYMTYVDGFVAVKSIYEKYVIYITLFVSFCLIYIFFAHLVTLVFVLLFACTGGLGFLLTLEKFIPMDLQFNKIIDLIQHATTNGKMSIQFFVYLVVVSLGIYLQLTFIPSISYL